jgi:hypothetical protein
METTGRHDVRETAGRGGGMTLEDRWRGGGSGGDDDRINPTPTSICS